MLMKNSTPSLARRLLGGIGAAALITVGLAASANYGYADDDVDVDAEVDVDTKVVTEKRVLVFTGVEDEIIFDDVVVGDRVRVMQFDDGDGEHRIIRIDGDNLEHDFDVVKVPHDGISWSSTGCVAGDGEGEPVMLEFKEESGEGEHKSAYHTVICLTGEDAKPENRAAALEKAITDLETRAKEEEARRKASGATSARYMKTPVPKTGEAQLPIAGLIKVNYGNTDDIGAVSKGIKIEGRGGALVVAPMGGVVDYAGPFKGYGQIVILRHQKGYHSLIAGLDKIDTVVEQAVSAGEPIGKMASSGGKSPLLYYELRYKGQPVNPSKKISGLR